MKRLSGAELAEFRKLDHVAQRKALIGTEERRTFVIERAEAIDEKARTAWLSIASEEPYERWWGVEILDVSKGAIRDARLKAGAPLLVGHDSDRQVGVVEAFEITGDKRLRVLARFSRSAYAEEIFRDVLDGIRKNTSVGYIIHDLVLEKQEEDVFTYRVTDWEPLEGSLVAVPADFTVGVGRSRDPAEAAPTAIHRDERTMEKTKEQIEQETKAAADKAAREAVVLEQKRVADIHSAGDQFKDRGGPEIAAKHAKDPNGTVDSFRKEMLDKVATKSPATPTGAPAADRPATYGKGVRNIIHSGQLRGFRDIEFNDGSKMSAQEAAYRAGQWALAAIYGSQRAVRWCKENGLGGHLELRSMNSNEGQDFQRDLNESVGSQGGFLVPVEMEVAIIDLRVQYGVARRLARYTPMGSGALERPRRTGGVTAYFTGDTAGATASDKSWDKVRLQAKLLNALSKMSTSVVEDAVIDLAQDVADEQAYAFATKEDQCMFVGDGTSTYGGIRGINTIFEANTTWKGFVIAATNHDTWPEIDNTDVTTTLGFLPTFGRVGARWVVSPLGEATMFGRLKASAGGNTAAVLRDGVVESDYLGYPVTLAEVMPSGTITTDYSNKVMALLGNFSKGVMFGERRGITVQVLRELYAANNEIGVLSTERIDIVAHDLGDANTAGPIVALAGQ